ncbi:hypothetical protein BDW22DRAFT_1207644 [Trametopsis cervina]|nr:hypothetical protein BDW22DRAFT_1207644 [Trametopsis cervina]
MLSCGTLPFRYFASISDMPTISPRLRVHDRHAVQRFGPLCCKEVRPKLCLGYFFCVTLTDTGLASEYLLHTEDIKRHVPMIFYMMKEHPPRGACHVPEKSAVVTHLQVLAS